MKISISKKIFEKFPELKIGVVVAKGIDNKTKNKEIASLLKDAASFANKAPQQKIDVWKKAYQSFGVDPNKYKPSIINLIELAKKKLPTINNLVDLYNYISAKYTIPLGGSDLSKIKGNIYLRIAEDKQPFTPLNSSNVEYTKQGEIVYSDDEKIITKSWNYKESDFTKFTQETTNAILELEVLPPTTDKELTLALAELCKLIEAHCNGKTIYFVLNKDCPTLDVNASQPSEQFIEFAVKKEAPAKIIVKELNEFQKKAAQLLQSVTNLKLNEIGNLLETPPDTKLGDIAFPCFTLAKQMKKSPMQIANELAGNIKAKSPFSEVKAVGPYVNFFLDNAKLTKDTLSDIIMLKNKYGYSKKHKKVALVEFPGPNTNKPLHIGHMRNMALGESVSRLLGAIGYTVKRVNIVNDRGVHICKSMLAYQKWGKNKPPNKKPDHYVGDFYVLYSQKAKENPELEKEIQDMLVLWEKEDKKTLAVWKKMNDWVNEGFAETYKRFGIKHDKEYYESDYYKGGRDIVLDGLKKGIFYKNAEGDTVANLGELGEKVLLRANGTSVYITQDMCLAHLRYKDYEFDNCIYVVAQEQRYHFQALFKLFKLLNYPFADSCYHLAHGMVSSPTGRFKSREGTTADVDNILDELHELVEKEINKRNKLPKKKSCEIAEKISLAAAKYLMLKYNALKDFVFNPNESISLEGDTGPYLQYSLVRAKHILDKVKGISENANYKLLSSDKDMELVKKLAIFPQVVNDAAEKYAPHIIANYANELAQLFSSFYEACPVLNAHNKDVRNARLALVKAFYYVLKNALYLLGIEEVEVM